MNEALKLIQARLAEVRVQKEAATERVRKAKEAVDLAQQERDLYTAQLSELQAAVVVLQKAGAV